MTTTRWIVSLALPLVLAACGAGGDDAKRTADAAHEEHEDAPPTSTLIPAAIAEASGIRVAAAAPGVIADEHEVQGLLTPIEGRTAVVTARFPGPVRALRVRVGDVVRAGQALASIESNLSLTAYAVVAPIAGTVLEQRATVGAVAGEGAALYEIADLSELWVDLHIFGADAQHIAPGVPVAVTRLGDGVEATTTLQRVLPATATASQSTVARATLRNADGRWRPGTAVKARITVDRAQVPLAVPVGALQTAGDHEVVYVRSGDTYSMRTVRVGRRDAQRVEILSGLAAGEDVVVEQSFLVKADIGKSTAEHDD